MKKVYVVSVQWYEDGKWHNTTLCAFSERLAAHSYVKSKREAAALDPTKQNDHYYIETLICWDHNYLKSE